MRTSKRCGMGAVVGLLVLALISNESAAAAPGEDCSTRLTLELTPDVPDAGDGGFLSSLLGDHPAYRLELLKQTHPSRIEVALSAPAPAYLCRNVVEDMRRDGRVLSIAESPSAPTTGMLKTSPELWGIPVSSNGIGSLYWAAHHPGRAWKVLLPLRSRDPGAVQ
jgi:hypothetical protein